MKDIAKTNSLPRRRFLQLSALSLGVYALAPLQNSARVDTMAEQQFLIGANYPWIA